MTDIPKNVSLSDDGADILREIGKTLTSTLELDQVLNIIMDTIAGLYEPRDWSLLMVDEEQADLYFAIVVGEAADELKDMRLKIGEGVAGWVAKNGEPVVITEAYKDERFAKWVDEKSGFKTDSLICVPLISKGRTLGVIELLNIARSEEARENIDILESLADFAAIAIENARFVEKVKQLTMMDDATGLYNARHMNTLLDTEISRAHRTKTPFAVVFLDLDHFKNVNDTYGHLVGSRLLREIGELLKGQLRTVDWAIRYGGDEFVLILPGAGREDAIMVTERLREKLNGEVFFHEEGYDIKITASFGVACFPECGKTKEEIIRLADKAMYRVKEASRDGIRDACEDL